jgi:hypothetical protein
MNYFTLEMDRSEFRVSRNDGLNSEERNSSICCTPRLGGRSGSQ